MADKQDERGEEDECLRLREDLVSLVTKRLGTSCACYQTDAVSRILDKRRRRWRQRHKLEDTQSNDNYTGISPAVHDERDALLVQLITVKTSLSQRRKDGLRASRNLQMDQQTLCHQVITGRLAESQHNLQTYCEALDSQETHPETSDLQVNIIENLEDTLSQAQAIASIHQMKHHMTPCIPRLQTSLAQQTSFHEESVSPVEVEVMTSIMPESVSCRPQNRDTEAVKNEDAVPPVSPATKTRLSRVVQKPTTGKKRKRRKSFVPRKKK